MPDTMIAVVTGANKGIGQQIAAQLANLGHTVVIGARDGAAGQRAAEELKGAAGEVSSVVLDVTDPASAAAAAKVVQQRYGRVDALINNAGISGRPGADFAGRMPATANVDDIRYIFETNVFGVITVTAAFLPLLRRSAAPRIVNVSSSAGSLALTSDFDNQNPIALGYVPSKTALTSLTIQYARGLAAEKILVNAVCPGFVATDLNGFRGVRSPEQGATQAVAMATIPADGPTGTFTDDQGPVPW